MILHYFTIYREILIFFCCEMCCKRQNFQTLSLRIYQNKFFWPVKFHRITQISCIYWYCKYKTNLEKSSNTSGWVEMDRPSVLLHALLLCTSRNYISAAHGTDSFRRLLITRMFSLRCHLIVRKIAFYPACLLSAARQIRTHAVIRAMALIHLQTSAFDHSATLL